MTNIENLYLSPIHNSSLLEHLIFIIKLIFFIVVFIFLIIFSFSLGKIIN